MERRGNTRVGNPRRRRKLEKRRRGGGKMSGIERGETGSQRRAHQARKARVDRRKGRGGSLGFLRNGKRRIERTDLRLVRVMEDVKREELGMMMRIGRIDNGLDPVMRIGRIDIAPNPEMRIGRTDTAHDPEMRKGRANIVHDPTKIGVNDTGQLTVMKGKTVNLPDPDSTEIRTNDQDHASTESHHLDQNQVKLLGMVNPT